jgi:hypothetical protein
LGTVQLTVTKEPCIQYTVTTYHYTFLKWMNIRQGLWQHNNVNVTIILKLLQTYVMAAQNRTSWQKMGYAMYTPKLAKNKHTHTYAMDL